MKTTSTENGTKVAYTMIDDDNGEFIGGLDLSRENGTYTIEDIHVERKFRGHGFGSKLVKSVIESEKVNTDKIGVNLRKEEVRELNFFKKLGFDITNCTDGSYSAVKKLSA